MMTKNSSWTAGERSAGDGGDCGALCSTRPGCAEGGLAVAAKTDGADDAKAETKATPLTAQQLKMKDCGAKWQEEKKAKGVKGRDAWNKFRSDCMKS